MDMKKSYKIEKDKYIIFGTGNFAEWVFEKICKKVNIIAFADNNSKKWTVNTNEQLFQLPIINPNSLYEIVSDCEVIIASTYFYEIYNQLIRDLGIDDNKIRIITPQRKKFIDENERLLGDDFIRVVDDLFVDNDFYKYKLLYKDNKFFVNNECVELEVSKNICISKGFTLFITTYNRPELLKRCLNYFSSCLDDNFIISKIYVIDVSEEKFFKENDDVIKEYKNIEINHNKYELGVFFHKFIFEVYEQIEDDYIAVCADDDFLMKESITRSIYEMETDNEIITVLGNQYYFIDNDLNNFYYNEFIDSKNCIYSKNVIDRIGNKNEQYEGLYKVFNKKLYKNLLDENVEFLANKNIIYVQLRELFYYYMLPLYGKMKYVSMPFGIRNADTNSWGGEVNSYNNLHSTIEHKKLEEHYSLARIHMVKKIIKLGKNEELAEKITDKVFTYFFEQQIERYKNVEGINIEQRFLEKDYFKIIDGKFINAK